MVDDKALRAQLVKLLDFEEAHVGFDRAVTGIPVRFRGKVPAGGEYSLWQLVEHLRIAQADILEFCRTAKYKEKKWPDDYWPKALGPRHAAEWTKASEFLVRARGTKEFRDDAATFVMEAALWMTAGHVDAAKAADAFDRAGAAPGAEAQRERILRGREHLQSLGK